MEGVPILDTRVLTVTGERDKDRPGAVGEGGEESSLAWAPQETDRAPMVLFTTVAVLDFGPQLV